MVGELDFDLVEIAERVVQDRLLSLSLSLTLPLCLAHLLLLLLLLSSLRLLWSKWHQKTRLALCLWLDWTTAKDIARASRSTKRKTWLWLRACKTCIAQKTVRTVYRAWPDSHRLVEMHRSRLSLVLWRLFQSLTLLLAVLSVLLFFDVDLLDLPHSLTFPVRCRRLSRCLAQCWQCYARTIWSMCGWRWLSGRRLAHAGQAGQAL